MTDSQSKPVALQRTASAVSFCSLTELINADRQQLFDQLALIHDALDIVTDRISIVDKEGTIIFTTDSVATTYGKPIDEILGLSIKELVSLETFNRYLEEPFQLALKGKRSVETAVLPQTSNSGAVSTDQLDLTVTPWCDNDGQIIGVIFLVLDKSRHLLNEELSTTRQQLLDYASASSDWQWQMDRNLRFTWISDRLVDIYGVDPKNYIGAKRQNLSLDQDQVDKWEEHIELLNKRLPFSNFDYPIKFATDKLSWARISGVPIFDEKGEFDGYRGVGSDISELKEMEISVAQAHTHFKRAIDQYPGAFVLIDKNLNVLEYNRCFSDLYKPYTNLVAGKPVIEYLTAIAWHENFEESKGKEEQWIAEKMHALQHPTEAIEICRHGSWYRVEYHHMPDGSCLCTMHDITSYKQMEMKLKKSETRFRDVADTAADWFWETDAQMRISYLSERFYSLTEIDADQVIGIYSGDLASPLKLEDDGWRRFKDAYTNKTPFSEIKLKFERPNNKTRYFIASGKPVLDDNGALTGFRGSCHDITTATELQKKLQYQATHDALTGLPNRSEFEKQLAAILSDEKNFDKGWAVGYLDLDQFKVVNDTAGHVAGDQLLSQIGSLISSVAESTDLIARLGGDEFGLLVRRDTIDDVLGITDQIIEKLENYRFEWDGRIFSVNASIGLVQITEEMHDQAELLSSADVACYTAKDLGRAQTHLFQPTDFDQLKRHNELLVAAGIKEAIENDQFILYAQPIVRILNGQPELSHYEVLLRMQDLEGNLIPPGSFIPAAERFNLMNQLDRWVLDTTLSQLNTVLQGNNDIDININLSGQSLTDKTLTQYVRQSLKKHNVAPERICFELTETAAISNLEQADRFIRSMKSIGCRFALDDFGAGLSSFSYIKHFPVDYVKIDGAFVKDIITDPTDRVMVSAINQMAHLLGMETIAEFVENDDILRELEFIGVDFAQGFGIGKPVPFEPGLLHAFGELLTVKSHAA